MSLAVRKSVGTSQTARHSWFNKWSGLGQPVCHTLLQDRRVWAQSSVRDVLSHFSDTWPSARIVSSSVVRRRSCCLLFPISVTVPTSGRPGQYGRAPDCTCRGVRPRFAVAHALRFHRCLEFRVLCHTVRQWRVTVPSMPGLCNNATTSRDQLPQTFCSKPDTTGARALDRLFSTRPMLGNILPRRRVSPRHSMVDQVATCAPSSFDRPRMSMLVPHFGFSFFQRLHRLLLRQFMVDGKFRGTLAKRSVYGICRKKGRRTALDTLCFSTKRSHTCEMQCPRAHRSPSRKVERQET